MTGGRLRTRAERTGEPSVRPGGAALCVTWTRRRRPERGRLLRWVQLWSSLAVVLLSLALLGTAGAQAVASLASLTAPVRALPGETFAVTWEDVPDATARDWLGLYPAGANDRDYVAWQYVSCGAEPVAPRPSGSCSFTAPASPGDYEVRLFADDSFRLLASATVAVVQPTQTATPTSTATATATPSATATATATDTPTATSTSTPTATATPLPWPVGGAFVIGRRAAVVGNRVTFWGARWQAANAADDPAPARFKGFVAGAVPRCGQPATWTAAPDDRNLPPSSLPEVMAVIVTGDVDRSGPTASGEVRGIALVRTDAGYRADPGHAGTGTVLALLCT